MNSRIVEISPKLSANNKEEKKKHRIHAYTREERNGRREYYALQKEKILSNHN